MQKGYTLVEMLLTLMLASVLGLVSVSSLSELNTQAQNSIATQIFITDVAEAKLEATRQGARVYLKAVSSPSGYTVGVDYPPYSNTQTADSILNQRKLPKNMTISFPSNIIFDGRGFLIDTNGNISTGSALIQRSGSVVKAYTVDALGGIS